MATAALASVPTLLASAAAPQGPRDIVSLQAHKLAEALNAANAGAWEVNIRYQNGFVLIVDRDQPELGWTADEARTGCYGSDDPYAYEPSLGSTNDINQTPLVAGATG